MSRVVFAGDCGTGKSSAMTAFVSSLDQHNSLIFKIKCHTMTDLLYMLLKFHVILESVLYIISYNTLHISCSIAQFTENVNKNILKIYTKYLLYCIDVFVQNIDLFAFFKKRMKKSLSYTHNNHIILIIHHSSINP